MRKVGFFICVLLIIGCGVDYRGPLAGDEIQLHLSESPGFRAGQPCELRCVLRAKNREGKSRFLNVQNKNPVNPVAALIFYDAKGNVLTSSLVELSERC